MANEKEYSVVLYEVENKVAKITMNNPGKLNALDESLAVELTDALLRAGADENVKVIVLTGAGKAFCAGGDVSHLNELDLEGTYNFVKTAQGAVDAFKSIEKPIIAAVNGYAIGAGLSLALLSDIVISSDKAVFGCAFVKLGLVPDMGLMYTLPRAVGLQKANELAMTGKNIKADEALRLGIVNTVVESEKLGEAVNEMAQLLASHPRRAMGSSKKLMSMAMNMTLEQLLEAEALEQAVCTMSEDAKEGMDAFLNKRQPNFK